MPTGQDKVVYYWVAEATPEAVAASDFSPNDEVLALHWLDIEAARATCTYRHDRTLIDALAARIADDTASTFAIVALRHAKAKDASAGIADADRPLTSRGREQAAQIAPGIAAFGVRRIVSSTAARCVATVEPLAARTGIEPRTSRSISQDEFAAHGAAISKRIDKAVAKRRSTVLCSHLPVIPAIVSAVVAATGSPETPALHRASMLHSSDFSVLHVAVATGRLLTVETHSAPL